MEVIERSAETTLLKASQKQIALEVDVPAGLPMVRGDASLLRDVLQNLIDNAIQYTSEGGRIQVNATAGAREVVVTVADTGIGIPLGDQERIFERFYRVDAARSREAGGTGLGLSIAKHIVEAHGGRLWVESEVGRGSKFFFLHAACGLTTEAAVFEHLPPFYLLAIDPKRSYTRESRVRRPRPRRINRDYDNDEHGEHLSERADELSGVAGAHRRSRR